MYKLYFKPPKSKDMQYRLNIAPNFYYKQEQNEPIYTLAASAKVLVISV